MHHTLFVDWDGTLSQSKFWAGWSEPKHPLHELHETVITAFAPEFAPMLEGWMRGRMSAESFAVRFARVAAISSLQILEGLQESAEAMEWADPRLPDRISQLRRVGYRVVIATDNMDSFRRWTVPGLALDRHVDGILDSFHLRALKSDMENATSNFFTPYLRTHQITPSTCTLIDDRASNQVVKGAGMNFHHVVDPLATLDLFDRLLEAI